MMSPHLRDKTLQRTSAPSTSRQSGTLSPGGDSEPFLSSHNHPSHLKAQGAHVSKEGVVKSHRSKSLDLDLLEQDKLHSDKSKDNRASSIEEPGQKKSSTESQKLRQGFGKALADPRTYAHTLETMGGATILAGVGGTLPTSVAPWTVIGGIGARVAGNVVTGGLDATAKARKKHDEREQNIAKGNSAEKDTERHSPKGDGEPGMLGDGLGTVGGSISRRSAPKTDYWL